MPAAVHAVAPRYPISDELTGGSLSLEWLNGKTELGLHQSSTHSKSQLSL